MDRKLYFNASRLGDIDEFKNKARKLWRSIPQAAHLTNEDSILAAVTLAIKDIEGRTVLHIAAIFGQVDFCRFLLETLGVDVDLQDGRGYTPLILALKEKAFNTANYLIQSNANVNIANWEGHTALHAVIFAGDEMLVRELIRRGADVNARCEATGTPLLVAAILSNHHMMEILLDENADPNITHPKRKPIRDENRWTYCDDCPLFESVMEGSLECVRMLVERGADASVVSHGETVLHYAAREKVGEVELFDWLKRLGNINVLNHQGLLPVHVAANKNNEAAFLALRPTQYSNIKSFQQPRNSQGAERVFQQWRREGKRRLNDGNVLGAICMFESCLLAFPDEEIYELLFNCHKPLNLEAAIALATQWCFKFPQSKIAIATLNTAVSERL